MEKLWQTRKPPTPLELGHLPGEDTSGGFEGPAKQILKGIPEIVVRTSLTVYSVYTINPYIPVEGCSTGGLADQRVWSISECAQVFQDW